MILIAIAATDRDPARVVSVESPSVVIGRDARCDVVLDTRGVSSQHCRLSPMGGVAGAYMLEDLGSTFGTFVSGARVGRPVVVSGNDAIMVGEHAIRITAPGHEAEAIASLAGAVVPPAAASSPSAAPGPSPSAPYGPSPNAPYGSSPSAPPGPSLSAPPGSSPSAPFGSRPGAPAGPTPTTAPGAPPLSVGSPMPREWQPPRPTTQTRSAAPEGTDWASQYSHYDALAKAWDAHGRPRRGLLRGGNLQRAVGWLRAGRALRPGPTPLHRDFVDASRRAGRRRFAWTFAAMGVVVVASVGVAAALDPDRARQILATVDTELGGDDDTQEATTDSATDPAPTPGRLDFDELTAQASGLIDPEVRLLAQAEIARRARLDQFYGPTLGALQRSAHQALAGRRSVVLSNRGAPIRAVAFGPHGRWALGGSDDNEAALWDLTVAAPARPIRLHENLAPVVEVGISRDGRWALTCDEDGDIVRWNLTSSDPAAAGVKLEAHEHAVRGVAFDVGGRWAMTADALGKVAVWDLGADPAAALAGTKTDGHDDAVNVVMAAPGGGFFTGGEDRRAFAWTVTETGRPRRTLRLDHDTGVTAVEVGSSGRWVATGDALGQAFLWDLKAKNPTKPKAIMTGHTEAISAVGISPDENLLVTASDDDTMRIWEIKASDPGASSVVLSGHSGDITNIAFAGRGTHLVSAALDNSVRVWDLTKKDRTIDQYVLDGHTGPVFAVTVAPDGLFALSGSDDGTLRLWDVFSRQGGQSGRVLRGASTLISDAAVDAGGDRLLVTGGAGRVELWDLRSRARIPRPARYSGAASLLNSGALGAHGYVAAGAENGKIYLWPTIAQSPETEPRVLSGHEGSVNQVAYTPDGSLLISASSDRSVRVWPTQTLQPRVFANIHPDEVHTLALTPDGRYAFTGSLDGTIVRWDLQATDGAPALLAGGHKRDILALAVSRDGRWLASGSNDRKALVWDVSTAQLRFKLKDHEEGVSALAFDRTGRRLATGGQDRQIYLWDLDSEDPQESVGSFAGHEQSINALTFVEDIGHLASASNDGTVRLWPLAGGPELVFLGHDALVSKLLVPRSGSLVSISYDGSARVWPTAGVALAERICDAIGRPLSTDVAVSLFGGTAEGLLCAPDRTGG